MKITKDLLRTIIKEELEDLPDTDDFSKRKASASSIADGIIDHLEKKELFTLGEIPQSIIKVIQNLSLRIADATKEMD